MEHKKYNIKTIQELVDVTTPENFGHLMKDLTNFIVLAKNLTSMGKMDTGCFTWIDDGKSDVHMTIKFPENEVWNEETKKDLVEQTGSIGIYDEHTNEIKIDSFAGTSGKTKMKFPDIDK
jgi:hypothetical protein